MSRRKNGGTEREGIVGAGWCVGRGRKEGMNREKVARGMRGG